VVESDRFFTFQNAIALQSSNISIAPFMATAGEQFSLDIHPQQDLR
jgi:hypothetical protein